MPATTGKIGYGSQLLMDDGLGVYTALANVQSIDLNESFDTIEATHMLSDNAYREYIANLKDGGDCSVKLHFDVTNATQNHITGLRKKFANRTLTNFRVVYPDGGNRDNFSAFVSKVGRALKVDSIMELDVTLKITGPVTPSAHP
jgi:predicted secreted protein